MGAEAHRQEEDGTSLGPQEAAQQAYALAHSYQVDEGHVYIEVHTGTELWERKQLARLRDAVRRREVDVVIAYALDRLSRDPVHLGVIISEAEHAGVDVQFVTEPLDNRLEGQLIRFVRGYVAKVEHEKFRERFIRWRRARVEAGKLLPGCRAKYGYRFRDADKTAYDVDPATGPIAARIWREAARGHTLRQIAAALTAEGIPTPTGRGRPRWDFRSIRYILADTAYGGQATAWRSRLLKDRQQPGSQCREIRPLAEQITLPEGTIPPIVDMATFRAVQDRLRLNQEQAARNNRAPAATLLRAGYARCGYCGNALVVSRARPARNVGPTYRCPRGRMYRNDCPGCTISCHIVDDAVWKRVEALVTQPDVVLAELARLDDGDSAAEDVEAIDKRLEVIGRQERNLVDELAELGPAVKAIVREKLAGLEAQRQQLTAEQENILARLTARQAAKERLAEIEQWCRTVGENLAELSYEKKRLMLDALGVRVRVWRQGHTPRYVIEAEPLPGSPIVSSTTRCARRPGGSGTRQTSR